MQNKIIVHAFIEYRQYSNTRFQPKKCKKIEKCIKKKVKIIISPQNSSLKQI